MFSIFKKFKDGLTKTVTAIAARTHGLFGGRRIDATSLEELEEALYTADFGVETTTEILADSGVRELMEEIFGPLDKLSADWTRWVKQTRNSFHFVDWGWEQEGNALFAYGFPWDAKYWSQTDLNYAPQEKLEYDPLRMDYPAEPRPPIVGALQQGVAEPSVGYVFDGVGTEEFRWHFAEASQVVALQRWCALNVKDVAVGDLAVKQLVARNILPEQVARARVRDLLGR